MQHLRKTKRSSENSIHLISRTNSFIRRYRIIPRTTKKYPISICPLIINTFEYKSDRHVLSNVQIIGNVRSSRCSPFSPPLPIRSISQRFSMEIRKLINKRGKYTLIWNNTGWIFGEPRFKVQGIAPHRN